ncbi:recombinase family protein [[Clostridium] innocuum]|uniref:recombinase family protein n=1 Tax=Clostridium innocuum TaxID=1522 RepID=UPI000D6CD2F8|nr:recombinase family protein [[Clostridium] innocuum]PWJ19740.1 site-specific DNA recombinase [[Clostridium] innocuum]SSA37462.1 Site-specific DNA recombinase [[Clostridium] innocuum]
MEVMLRKKDFSEKTLIEADPEQPKKIRVIPARKKFLPTVQQESTIKRVAPYCRVSTDSDEQELSFESQCLFYKQMVNSNPNYELVDIYADEGVTGTSTEKREDFMRLMNDCLKGKIDMVITKSVTRFARNTLDSIIWIRKLKALNIDVYFEMENLHSLTASEMVITMLSSLAQESSQNKSESVRWGYTRQFEKGKTYLGNLYGYHVEGDKYYIHEEEAKVVKSVFEMYLAGYSDQKIADFLTEKGVLTKQGKKVWKKAVVQRMLQNIKYSGDSIQGLSFNEDCLNQKRQINRGQRNIYYVENSHKGIVSKEIYKAAQVERARRNSKIKVIEFEESMMQNAKSKKPKKNKCGMYSSQNALSNRIICADCGSYFRRAVWTKRDGSKQPVWRCINKLDNGVNMCPYSPTLKEKLLFEEIAKIVNKILSKKDRIKMDLAQKASQYINPKDIVSKINKTEKSINKVDLKISQLLDQGMILVTRGVQDECQLKEHLEELYQSKRKLTEELGNLKSKLDEIRKIKEEKVLKTLNEINASVSCLSQEEIAIFIEEIIVYADHIEILTKTGQRKSVAIGKVK